LVVKTVQAVAVKLACPIFPSGESGRVRGASLFRKCESLSAQRASVAFHFSRQGEVRAWQPLVIALAASPLFTRNSNMTCEHLAGGNLETEAKDA